MRKIQKTYKGTTYFAYTQEKSVFFLKICRFGYIGRCFFDKNGDLSQIGYPIFRFYTTIYQPKQAQKHYFNYHEAVLKQKGGYKDRKKRILTVNRILQNIFCFAHIEKKQYFCTTKANNQINEKISIHPRCIGP